MAPTLVLLLVLLAAAAALPVTSLAAECRSERGVHLPRDQFRSETCARCYHYMPATAFKRKFRYDGRSGALLDPLDNSTHSTDSPRAADSFLDSTLLGKWRDCCRAALDCCDAMTRAPPRGSSHHCPRTWDGWQCWPDTPSGTVAGRPCPDHIYFETEPPRGCARQASKRCTENGTWYRDERLREWTDYVKCGRRDEHRRRLWFHVTAYVTSIVAIVPALFIFAAYKQLRVPRISMHRHLLCSLLLNGLASVLFKALVVAPELDRRNALQPSVLDENGWGCRVLLTLTKYFRCTNYAWMFCEGFYLHKLIAAAFAEQRTLAVFHVTGWALPALPAAVYAVLRATLQDEKCWAFPVERYEWITNAPNLLSLLANLFFLCNIVRVLVTKLRATHANEPSQFRKAVRATAVLFPLFGLHFCLVLYRPPPGACGPAEVYAYFNHALDGLQGLLVALLFCYLNGEVHYLLKRSYQRHRLRGHFSLGGRGGALLRRLSATQDSTLNDSHASHHREHRLREINRKTEEETHKV